MNTVSSPVTRRTVRPPTCSTFMALADIPETEFFAGKRNPLVSKFASSAAHVRGGNLVGAETGTWLAEHFTETLGEMKSLVDELFLSGVSHVFYHGTCYSPDEAAWPAGCFMPHADEPAQFHLA